MDNTNFGGGGGGGGYVPVPVEDDYTAIRQAIWWMCDRDYKGVVETFARKKAFMESKLIEDKPDDYSHAQPVVHIEQLDALQPDYEQVKQLAVKLSEAFAHEPLILSSYVSVSNTAGNNYLINTEGTRIRTGGAEVQIHFSASVQANDGMIIDDSVNLYGTDFNSLPSESELLVQIDDLINRLLKIREAPKATEAYTGPILFEPHAASSIFWRKLANRFTGGQRPVGDELSADDFSKKLEKRILPRWMNVVDDPTLETITGTRIRGHYVYDDEGVKAKSVQLVENGKLEALVMSRNPSKEFSESTGHGRGWPAAATMGCMVVTAEETLTEDELRAEFLEAVDDEGLEYGLRIVDLGDMTDGMPLMVYKVYPDGREELVRGLELGSINLKAFKRILAAGDTPYVNNGGSRDTPRTLAAPALLFEDLT